MTRLKKLLSIVLAMTLMLTFSVGAVATEQPAPVSANEYVSVINRSNYISEQAINELVNEVGASLVYDDGIIVPLESTITIDDVTPLNKSRSENGGNKYRVAVRSKTTSDADDKNDEGVSASIYLAVIWEDVLGPSNIFESLEGNITIDEGTLTNSKINYYSVGNAGSSVSTQLGTKTSFYKDINVTTLQLSSSYQAGFKDATWQLVVHVTPTILD